MLLILLGANKSAIKMIVIVIVIYFSINTT